MDPLENWEKVKLEIGDISFDDQIDFYKNARDSFMQRSFPDYPNIQYDQFFVSFNIPTNAKNAPLVYAVLERFSDEFCDLDSGTAKITLPDEDSFYANIQLIYDLLSVAGSWKSFSVGFNGKEVSRTEIGYVADFLFERRGERPHYYKRSIDQIKNQYQSGKRRRPQKQDGKIGSIAAEYQMLKLTKPRLSCILLDGIWEQDVTRFFLRPSPVRFPHAPAAPGPEKSTRPFRVCPNPEERKDDPT